MLLDNSLLAFKHFQPQYAKENVVQLCHDTIEILAGQAELKNVQLKFVSRFVQDELMVDKMRVQQILLNLLTNALKFSPDNDIVKIALTCDLIGAKEVLVKIMVADYGIGISEEDQKNIFTAYFKTSNEASKAQNPNSNGLGLSICRQIANGLKGEIRVKSEVEVGSQFFFEFLAERVTNIQDLQNSAVLHIDREKFNAEKLRKKLKKETETISKKNKSLIQDLPE